MVFSISSCVHPLTLFDFFITFLKGFARPFRSLVRNHICVRSTIHFRAKNMCNKGNANVGGFCVQYLPKFINK